MARTPRKQIPLADSKRLSVVDEAFNMASSFRDGEMVVEFGDPGPPSGDTPTILLQVPCKLRDLLTGMCVVTAVIHFEVDVDIDDFFLHTVV